MKKVRSVNDEIFKPLGICSFCKDKVMAKVIGESTFMRDECQCTNKECEKTVRVCRIPGCDNFARSGPNWADEFCQPCTAGGIQITKKLIVGAMALAVTAAVKSKIKKD